MYGVHEGIKRNGRRGCSKQNAKAEFDAFVVGIWMSMDAIL